MSSWRERVSRGARALCLGPLVGLVVAPFAVFFRPALVGFALWHCYWVFRFTASEPQSAASPRSVRRWVLRLLAVAGVFLITLSYDGYRVLAVATVAAYLAYLSELLPALGVSPWKGLRPAAWGALLCSALLAGNLLLRPVIGLEWETIFRRGLSALAVPLGLLAWFELSRVAEPGREAESVSARSPRGWALEPIKLVVSCVLAAGFALFSAFAGFWFAWQGADLDPGALRATVLGILLCVDGAVALVLRGRSRRTVRRWVVSAGLSHIPLVWFLVFPTQFDARAWKLSPEDSQTRADMVQDLVHSRVLLGKTRSEMAELLGPPYEYPHGARQMRDGKQSKDLECYLLPKGPCRAFVIEFAGGRAVDSWFWMCD